MAAKVPNNCFPVNGSLRVRLAGRIVSGDPSLREAFENDDLTAVRTTLSAASNSMCPAGGGVAQAVGQRVVLDRIPVFSIKLLA
jgi:hypothetical protein